MVSISDEEYVNKICLVITLEERNKAKTWYLAEVKGVQPPKKPKRVNAWQASQGLKDYFTKI